MAPLARLALVAAVTLGSIFAEAAWAGTSSSPGQLPIRIAAVAGENSPGKITVEPGDHFWSISERSLRANRRDEVPDEQIAPYWSVVVEANRDRIRSGDPDLIFPGEVILLPSPDES